MTFLIDVAMRCENMYYLNSFFLDGYYEFIIKEDDFDIVKAKPASLTKISLRYPVCFTHSGELPVIPVLFEEGYDMTNSERGFPYKYSMGQHVWYRPTSVY